MSTAGSAPDRRQQQCCSPATTPRAKNCRVDDSVGEHRYRHLVRGHWRDGEWLENMRQTKSISDGSCRTTSTESRFQRSIHRPDLRSLSENRLKSDLT